MLARWILVRINRDLDTTRLMYAILEIGRTVSVVDADDFMAELGRPSEETSCVVVFGGVACTTQVMQQRKWIPGSWHRPEYYSCRNYYAAWGRYITQKQHVFLTLGELIDRHQELFDTLGAEEKLFVRPDESEKIFDGALVHRELFNGWRQMRELCGVPLNTLCVVARPVEIAAEYRVVIRGGRVVTGSVYRVAGSIELHPLEGRSECPEVVAFAETVAQDRPPAGLPSVYLMDLALRPGGALSVLEVQSISAAGLYRCDLVKLALAVSEEAELEWERWRNSSR